MHVCSHVCPKLIIQHISIKIRACAKPELKDSSFCLLLEVGRIELVSRQVYRQLKQVKIDLLFQGGRSCRSVSHCDRIADSGVEFFC